MRAVTLSRKSFGLKILYEGPDFLALDKPACLHSASLPVGGGSSVADILRVQQPALLEAARKKEDAGLVNRLDFETSGILLVAKTRKTWLRLHSMLLAGEIHKTYLAVVEGRVSRRQEIRSFIGAAGRRSEKVKVLLKASKKMRALPAASVMEPLAFDQRSNYSLASFEIGPGRRHQIRAHSAYIGHPLAGDSLYGAESKLADSPGERRNGLLLPGFLLHAETLSFLNPWGRGKIVIRSQLPAYWPKFRQLR